jgi:hypothetical protein
MEQVCVPVFQDFFLKFFLTDYLTDCVNFSPKDVYVIVDHRYLASF